MPRHIREFRLQAPPEQTFGIIHQYMIANGFTYTTFEGEQVFKKGDGWITAPNVVKVTYGPDRVRVEAWLRYAILPGVYGGELAFDGFVGCAVKGTIKKCFAYIEQVLGGEYAALCRGFDGDPKTLPPLDIPLQQLNGG